MCEQRVSLSQAITNLECLRPPVIFLTAKSCNGKSYFSRQLIKNSDYQILELDVLVRKLANQEDIGKAPDYEKAFSLYRNKGSSKFISLFVR